MALIREIEVNGVICGYVDKLSRLVHIGPVLRSVLYEYGVASTLYPEEKEKPPIIGLGTDVLDKINHRSLVCGVGIKVYETRGLRRKLFDLSIGRADLNLIPFPQMSGRYCVVSPLGEGLSLQKRILISLISASVVDPSAPAGTVVIGPSGKFYRDK